MEKLPKYLKALILLAALVVVFMILNFGYFWANINFLIHKPEIPSAQAVPKSAVNAKAQPNLLTINSLGIQAPIVYATATNETAYQAALINGVVHYPGTANPGQPGNCYIFGHSSDYIWSKGHYKNVFAILPSIEIGAKIYISDSQGNEFVYTVTDSHEVSAADLSVLNQGGNKQSLLTLQTSYPVGTALARWVVVGELDK